MRRTTGLRATSLATSLAAALVLAACYTNEFIDPSIRMG
jgi:hypothetical protein